LGGNSRITDDDYIEGAPELLAEIAASSAAYQLYDKKKPISATVFKNILFGRA
jgi:hypothetical protein